MEAAIKAVAENMLPQAIAAAVHAASQNNPRVASPPPAVRKTTCTECGQILETGCKGKHVQMVVFPQRYPEHAEFFQGVFLNGRRYLSNDENHKVVVPEECVALFNQIIQTFEQNEQDQRVGRSHQHRSGTVSPNGSSFNPARAAWR